MRPALDERRRLRDYYILLYSKPVQNSLRFIFGLALLLLSCGRSPATSHTNIQTLFLILMENVSWPDIVNGTNAPYLKSVLIPQSSYCSNMFIVPGTFGSLPQYLWL